MYAGTKAALVGFAKSLAVEIARDNVTINVVSPGSTDTEFIRSILTEDQLARRIRGILSAAWPPRPTSPPPSASSSAMRRSTSRVRC